MRRALVGVVVCCVIAPALAQDDGQSLGDLARQVRQQRAAQATQAAEPAPAKVYTNQDIPKWSDEVTWKSSPASAATTSVNLDPAQSEHPIQVKRQDVECSFFFRAQDLLPAGKGADDSGLRTLPAGEVARLAGTGSIWGNKFDISIHNDTGWELREVTVRLVTGSDGAGAAGNSRPAAHDASDDPPPADANPSGRLLSMQVDADPFSAAISTKQLGAAPSAGEKWSWEIVQAKGIPPKTNLKN